MYTETNFEIFMIVASWFLRKKDTRMGRNLPKKGHGKTHFIILRFTIEHKTFLYIKIKNESCSTFK